MSIVNHRDITGCTPESVGPGLQPGPTNLRKIRLTRGGCDLVYNDVVGLPPTHTMCGY